MLFTLLASCLTSPHAAILPQPTLVANIRSTLTFRSTAETASTESVAEFTRAHHLAPWEDIPEFDLLGRSLQLQDDTADTADTDDTDQVSLNPAFGASGSTRWTLTGGFGIDSGDTSNTEYGLGLGMQWFLVDDFAFAPTINIWGFSQEVKNAFGGSVDLMFQWHFIKGESWTLFSDFGCGLLGSNNNVPSGGSQFNFTPQAGLGVTFDVGQDRRWIVGVRWHHISNASLYQNNPGRDNVLVYTGLSLPF